MLDAYVIDLLHRQEQERLTKEMERPRLEIPEDKPVEKENDNGNVSVIVFDT